MSAPPKPPIKTMTQGGTFQNINMLKRIAVKAKSIGVRMELTHIG